jgi:electron-transferring-flavoprotein dehydrogenase
VVIVGAGPAGLASAIRLKQLAPERSVIVVEKGSAIGAHILSGAVIDPIGLERLLPDWRKDPCHPLRQPVQRDELFWLTQSRAVRLPSWLMPPLMSNRGSFVVSLGTVCRWLAGKAEELGVELYPGFAAAQVLYGKRDEVLGVATGDMGIGRDRRPKPNFSRGVALRAKYTLLAEGARGSLTKTLLEKYGLGKGRDPPKFGIGVKELWQVPTDRHQPGLVRHTFGWPLDNRTGGGSFLYHWGENLVSVGFVVHLDYPNPWIDPFEELQRFKTHPFVRAAFGGGKRIGYGARAITEGGWQSAPKLTFPGGALIGCAAGFVSVPRIKGVHNAMLSGILAAENVAEALAAGRAHDELTAYETSWRSSAIGLDLRKVRNVKPLWSKYGTRLGVLFGGLDMWANHFGLSPIGTLAHGKADHLSLKPASCFRAVTYPKPDGRLTFDRLSSVFLSATNHEADQPVHLQVADEQRQRRVEHDVFGGPSTRYCPAGVYEWVGEGESLRYLINAQNCVHCKACDIKDPTGNITWTAPEGGGGPNYLDM